MTSSVRDSVRAVMADILRIHPSLMADDASMENVEEWDSGNHVSFVFALEEEFGVSFDVSEIEKMVSFEEVVAMVERKL